MSPELAKSQRSNERISELPRPDFLTFRIREDRLPWLGLHLHACEPSGWRAWARGRAGGARGVGGRSRLGEGQADVADQRRIEPADLEGPFGGEAEIRIRTLSLRDLYRARQARKVLYV